MVEKFSENLKKIALKFSQKEIALKTGFSQASINNYISGAREPSISFLMALKSAFDFSSDDLLFGNIETKDSVACDKFIGNYIVYYYNNTMYKGNVHNNISNTLNYGILSLFKDNSNAIKACASFLKDKKEIVLLLKELNNIKSYKKIIDLQKESGNFYTGQLNATNQNMFIKLSNSSNGDECFMIFNNPPSPNEYIGGIGTVNSVSRGREHNPCIQYAMISKKLIEKSDAEIYSYLQLDAPTINFTTSVKEIIDLVKRLYIDKDDLAGALTDAQKEAIVDNNIKFRFNEILDANMFRFAKISNREDDFIYKMIKEGEEIE